MLESLKIKGSIDTPRFAVFPRNVRYCKFNFSLVANSNLPKQSSKAIHYYDRYRAANHSTGIKTSRPD